MDRMVNMDKTNAALQTVQGEVTGGKCVLSIYNIKGNLSSQGVGVPAKK